MLVMKFGGASVKDAAGVRNVADILRTFPNQKVLAVVSAMDKTTNQLEILAAHARDHQETETWAQLDRIRQFHLSILRELFETASAPVEEKVQRWFEEVERIARGVLLLGEFPHRTYDRIVAYGELIATTIVSAYLSHSGIATALVDSRDLIRTDASYTQANVVWSITREIITREIPPLFQTADVVIAPGFIASSMDGKVTTLGREGSDYTAAIFASCLEAKDMTVWKDVPGILSGDPRLESQVEKIPSLSYEEAVEMTFYGATVLHPKTIKPLFNSGIPLFVKSFKELSEPGTLVQSGQGSLNIPSRIWKKNLAMVTLTSRDFSFMDEMLLGVIFGEVARTGIQLSLVQNTAVNLHLVVGNQAEALKEFESRLVDRFHVKIQTGMALRTIVHFTQADLAEAAGAALIQQADDKLFIVRNVN